MFYWSVKFLWSYNFLFFFFLIWFLIGILSVFCSGFIQEMISIRIRSSENKIQVDTDGFNMRCWWPASDIYNYQFHLESKYEIKFSLQIVKYELFTCKHSCPTCIWQLWRSMHFLCRNLAFFYSKSLVFIFFSKSC